MADVLVVGAGPAGRSLGAACADLGLRVTLVDPAPEREWPHTYALWREELPPPFDDTVVAASTDRMTAVGTRAHPLEGEYCVVDNTALRGSLHRDSVREVAGIVRAVEDAGARPTVLLRDGRKLSATVLVDASGGNRVLCGGRPARTASEQTAVGVVLDAESAAPLLGGAGGIFMDWTRPPHVPQGWPTFLYAVPLPGRRVLVEETALARRPGLPLGVLRERLRNRLASRGLEHCPRLAEERVRFTLDDPVPELSRTVPFGIVPFGAAAGLIHPATGFSVGAVLRLAPLVAGAVSAALGQGPVAAADNARRVLWPPRARLARHLRLRAAEGLLTMPSEAVPHFFDVFFTMRRRRRHAFLSPTGTPGECHQAMTELFRHSPWWLRRHLVLGGLGSGALGGPRPSGRTEGAGPLPHGKDAERGAS
ncbi:lycopene cyclase family protein [Actinopolyspora mortivallis]|uniref:lycopene cyclase family protein n=1 Tax=Actinopolyspora mortivallis TaxID=33906 RepID=UPI0003651667|nr:lycopene cyclase family protein [Actinopolyspora mortivallis]